MQIHELSIDTRNKKRIGRGGKRGTYSGRGMKGQKARSGGNVDPLFEGGRTTLVDKMKKNRGFKSPHGKKNVVSLKTLDAKYADGDTVSVETLVEKNIVAKSHARNGVRIVANGAITKKITVDPAIGASTKAVEAITAAGGTITDTAEKK